MPFIPHTQQELAAMLETVGVKSMDDLFADIPQAMRPKSFDLPAGLSEFETCAYMEKLADANKCGGFHFLGGGFYDHAIPKAVDALSSRGEFYTAYTPYQPEASQGTLQAIFEYQTAMCRLLDMDLANASVYDGGSAIFESAMMAVRATKRHKLVVDEAANPLYRVMLHTLTANLDLDIVIVPHRDGVSDKAALEKAMGGNCAAVIVQNPNFFGVVDDYTDLFAAARKSGALSILSAYPVLQSVLKTPGEMGADIATADGQSVGLPLAFGGPYLGVMTCTKALARQMPGRIVGRTVDLEGRTSYVLTLQAREQHIRRAKATSNICSNQALCALRALIHLCLLGPAGLARTAEHSMAKAREARKALLTLPGIKPLNDAPFGNEFALRLPKSAREVTEAMIKEKIVPGIPVSLWYKDMDNVLLVACTEKTQSASIEKLAAFLGGIL